MDFPGAITIDAHTLIDYGLDVCKSLAHHGFDAFSSSTATAATRRSSISSRGSAWCRPARSTAAVSYWAAPGVREAAESLRESEPVGGMNHACEFETSLYFALRPDLVDMKQAVHELSHRPSKNYWTDLVAGDGPLAMMEYWSQLSDSGVMGDPTKASAGEGPHRCSMPPRTESSSSSTSCSPGRAVRASTIIDSAALDSAAWAGLRAALSRTLVDSRALDRASRRRRRPLAAGDRMDSSRRARMADDERALDLAARDPHVSGRALAIRNRRALLARILCRGGGAFVVAFSPRPTQLWIAAIFVALTLIVYLATASLTLRDALRSIDRIIKAVARAFSITFFLLFVAIVLGVASAWIFSELRRPAWLFATSTGARKHRSLRWLTLLIYGVSARTLRPIAGNRSQRPLLHVVTGTATLAGAVLLAAGAAARILGSRGSAAVSSRPAHRLRRRRRDDSRRSDRTASRSAVLCRRGGRVAGRRARSRRRHPLRDAVADGIRLRHARGLGRTDGQRTHLSHRRATHRDDLSR